MHISLPYCCSLPFFIKLVYKRHTGNYKNHEYKGQAASGIPLHTLHKVLFDYITDQKNMTTAEHLRDSETRKRRNEYHNNSTDEA